MSCSASNSMERGYRKMRHILERQEEELLGFVAGEKG